MSPTSTSHKSTSGSARAMNFMPSFSTSTPDSPYRVSTAKRVAIAQSWPTVRRTFSKVSTQKRTRFPAEAGGDRAVVADGAPDFFQGFEPEARGIFQRAAVFVLALVVVGREELQ